MFCALHRELVSFRLMALDKLQLSSESVHHQHIVVCQPFDLHLRWVSAMHSKCWI